MRCGRSRSFDLTPNPSPSNPPACKERGLFVIPPLLAGLRFNIKKNLHMFLNNLNGTVGEGARG